MATKPSAQAPAPESRLPHSLVIEERSRLTATGVLSVVSCDAGGVTLETPDGTLTIGGEGLTVSELSVQTGEVRIGGSIEYVQYTQRREHAASLWKRLVR